MKHKVFQMIRSMDGEDIQLQLAMTVRAADRGTADVKYF